MSSTETITPSPHTSARIVEIAVPKSKSREFSSIRASLARMIFKVSKAITQKSPPLIDLKSLICLFNSDLKGKLAECNDISSVVYVIEGECSLTDIELLESVVEEFEVMEAERYIEQYKTTLEEFCHSMSLDLCLKEKFDAVNTRPSLKCETVTYVFDWRPDEKKLKDITDILSETSGGKLVKIKYIDKGNSIVVTCSFPHSLTGALIMKLIENLELLIKNGLMKLTVGYCTIWKIQKIQEIQEPLEEEVQEIKEQPHDTKEERVARLEEKETEAATPQSVINQDILSLDTSLTIINTQLIKEIKTNKHLKETLTKMKEEKIMQHIGPGLLNQNESLLLDINREKEELKKQISLKRIQILNKRRLSDIHFAIIIDNCGEVKIEEDGTRILNEQAKCLYEVLEGSGFCILYLNNLSSTAIHNLLLAFKNDVDHSQLSMFALIFLSKGKTPQLYDANNTVIRSEDMFQYFHDDQSSLSKIPKIFFFDVACLDDENKNQPSLPDCPSNSLALAVAHNNPNISFALKTLSQNFNQKSIQDIFRMISLQKRSELKINEKTGFLTTEKSKNVCLGDHLLLLCSLWYPIRSETVDVILKNKDEVMSIVRNERIARIATSVAGLVVGGGLVVTGIALAPFTFGASIGVSVAGGVVGALSSGGGIIASIASKLLASKRLKKAQEHIALDQQLSLTINNVARMHEQKVHETSLSQIAGEAAAGGIAGAARIGAGVAIAAEGTVEGAALALRTGGRIAGMVLAGVSLAVTVPIDVGLIAYQSYHIHKSNKDKTGRTDNNKVIQWLISQAEDMLKGMCIKIDAKHEIAGGQMAVCDGIEYGYKIYIPLTPVDSSITVHTIFSGPITLPEGYTLVSAMYDIKLPAKLPEPANITVEHCVDVNDMSIARNLCFAIATVDIKNRVLPFSQVSNGGVFYPGETTGSITLKENCFLCILYKGSLELMKYAAHVQRLQENFDITFLKNLKPHLKFSQQRPSIDSDYFYQFHFTTVADGGEQAINLSNCRDIIEAKGWTITPIGEIPQTITKREIDTLELQPKVWKLQNEVFPTIRFHTGYNEMDPPEELNHHLPIDGIDPDKPIALKRQEEAD